MEEQTEKSDARNGLRNDIPRLQSMLAKLNLKHKQPKTSDVKLHSDTVSRSVFYHSPEPEGSVTNEEDRENSTVRSDGDEEQVTNSLETDNKIEAVEEVKELPDVFPQWERKSLLPNALPIETQVAEISQQPSENEPLEDKKNKEIEEHVAGAALSPCNPSQETSAHTSYLSVSSDDVDSKQVGLKHEPLDGACGGSSEPVSMVTSRVLSHQAAVNVIGKTTRSASDPVIRKSKEERPLSAPSISNLREYEKHGNFTNAMPANSFSRAAKVLGQEYAGDVENDNSLTKTQKKRGKNKMKILTQKLIEKLKDKRDCEHTEDKSTQDSMEEEEKLTSNLNSMKVEAEAQDIPPPLPPKRGKYVVLDRRFTLRDFRLNLEPINLMEEIFTGSEWLSYLPIKESPDEKDTSEQSMTNNVLQPEKAIKLDAPFPTPEQNKTEDIKTSKDIETPKQGKLEDIKTSKYIDTPKQDKLKDIKTSKYIDTPKQGKSEDMKTSKDIETPKQDKLEDIKTSKDIETPKQDKLEDIKTSKDIETPKQDKSEDMKTSKDIETPKQDKPEDMKTSKDIETPKQDKPEDIKDNQDSVSDPHENNVAKANTDLDIKQQEQDANMFAIPKTLLTNSARAYSSDKSDDIYDCVDLYIIPKHDIPLRKRKASDAPLDVSAVKSAGLLDNSALKSRIRLSKKRHHRPPKQQKKVKTETSSAKFYNIPPVILNQSPVSASPTHHSVPFSTSPPLHLP